MAPPVSDWRARWGHSLLAGCATMFLLCSGGGYFLWTSAATDKALAESAARTFLNNLQAGNRRAAYESTHSGFRLATTPEQWDNHLQRIPQLTNHTSHYVISTRYGISLSGTHSYSVFRLDHDGPAMFVQLLLLEENGVWKVARLDQR